MSSSQYLARFDKENPYSATHWSQRKLKSFRLQQLPTGQVSVLCAPRVPSARLRRHSFDIQQLEKSKLASSSQYASVTTGDQRLNQEINYFLPALHLSRNLSTPSLNKAGSWKPSSRPASASNQRAKQGFKFWIDDKPKHSSTAKVTVGSTGSFLGLGVPRL